MWYTCSSICWSNPKIFLSVLVVFGKYFDLKNFHKNPKKIVTLHFWDSLMSHVEVTSSTTKIPRICFAKIWKPKGFVTLSWVTRKWSTQSWKRLVKIFNFFRKIDFSVFQPEAFATHSQLVGECKSQSRKRQKFFQNLGLRVFGDSLTSQLSR